MASVTIRDVRKSYGAVEVMHGVSVDIDEGEFVVLVGPSGCGKSTLLRMLAGLEHITSGDILIGDKVVNTLPPKDRDIAMVFQNYALYPHLTVAENMGFSLKLKGSSRAEIETKVKPAADILGLAHLLDRYPRQLSGGQRQRVAMGRAIVRDPQVFLFDEPLSNLDAKLRVTMRTEIKNLHQRLKTTTVYVTHDQIEAMTMADKIAVMNAGRIQQIDTPDEIYHRPRTRFVAEFMGEANILPGTALQPQGVATDDSLMIRAESFHLQPLEGPQVWISGCLTAKAFRGENWLLQILVGDREVLLSIPATRAQGCEALTPGTQITAWAARDRLHVFAPETGTLPEAAA